MSAAALVLQFLVQAAIVLVACRAAGALMTRLGQPRVIGEMIAGILLGPSLLGLFAPAVQAALFPPASLGPLSWASQLGLVLYMFVVGSHLQTGIIRRAFRSAAVISVAGIVVPFALGAALARNLHGDGRFFAEGVSRTQSAIYLGAAMAVTAFPVLARIIHDRGIGGTMLGTLALAAGATDDAIAWGLLAIVLAGVNPDFNVAAFLASHAVLLAFLAGAVLPRTQTTREITRRVESIAGTMLVPLFFAYSGLSTHLHLLWSRDLALMSIAVILIASAGKAAACWAAARLTGREPREAMAIGALMNARGLMELIMLNIGLQHGLITPTLYTVMVAMTLATTLAAGPLFEWAWRGSKEGIELAGVRAH